MGMEGKWLPVGCEQLGEAGVAPGGHPEFPGLDLMYLQEADTNVCTSSE